MVDLEELVVLWEHQPYNGNYEVRKMVRAYREDLLDAGAKALLREEIEEDLGGGINL